MFAELRDVIHLLLKLLDVRGEARRDILHSQVEPLMIQLRSVHADYLKTFKQYRDKLEVGTPHSAVVDNIRTDIRWSAVDRALLRQLAETISRSAPNLPAFQEQVRSLAMTVVVYLAFLNAGVDDDDALTGYGRANLEDPNQPREFVVRRLRSINPSASQREQQRLAIAAIDEAVDILQANMTFVNRYYVQTKESLT